MNNCVQCGEKMSEYKLAFYQNEDRMNLAVDNVYRCLKPACPNYALLQGDNNNI